MTQYLPPNLLALFAPRDPIPFLPPYGKLPHEKNGRPYQGISAFLGEFENPEDTPAPTRVETKDEKKDRKRREREEQVAYKLEQDLALWDPHNNPLGTGDAFKTLFVARISHDTSESKLRREFEVYGPINKIRMIHDVNTSKPRGYAFIEFQHERDMHAAYKHADGKKIDGRRVIVDVERSRTVKNWRPRRLGGGLGNTRRGTADENSRISVRDGEDMSRGRSRSRSRERRRERRRSPARERRRSRDRDDGERRRSRSRERRRRRSRSKDRVRRSRSRERKRPRRSRSRDRDRRYKERRREDEPLDIKQENTEQDGKYGVGGEGYPDDEGMAAKGGGDFGEERLLQPAYMMKKDAASAPDVEETNGAEDQ